MTPILLDDYGRTVTDHVNRWRGAAEAALASQKGAAPSPLGDRWPPTPKSPAPQRETIPPHDDGDDIPW